MKISYRLLLGYLIIVAVAAYFVTHIFVREIKPGARNVTESTMADTANLLARIAAQDMQAGNIRNGYLAEAFRTLNEQKIDAPISGISKQQLHHRVYVTDQLGSVVFDSAQKDLGKDFSRWRDVYHTLRGQYGARTTREDQADTQSSVMFIAAPILQNGEIIGSLTLSLPNRTMLPWIQRSEQRILWYGIGLIAISLLIGTVFVWWITHSLRLLTHYADDVSAGRMAQLPHLGAVELQQLASALQTMRQKLEGKAYIEGYVHTLTHELKSPLAAILGFSELLQESPEPEVSQRFAANIQQQGERIQLLIDRMLLLAKVESRARLEPVKLDLAELVAQAIQSKEAQLQQQQIHLKSNIQLPAQIWGDRLLVSQALINLLDNALDFTPPMGEIQMIGHLQEGSYQLCILDSGAGIPAFAQEKIFERFYSLPRPHKDKSTGLGLSFVREVMLQHKGRIQVTNRNDGQTGCCATLWFPVLWSSISK